VADLQAVGAPAAFLFSLGPDQTGRAITRVLRPGFFQKVSRTSVVQIYGVRTLLNGTLLPAPHIGRRNAGVMRAVRDAGFEPVMSGPLAKSAEFSMGTPGYGVHANATALKKVLGVTD
jgi:hypothetical protein